MSSTRIPSRGSRSVRLVARTAPVLLCRALGFLLVALLAAGVARGDNLSLDTQELVDNLVRPLGIVDPRDGSGRLFIVQQGGEIKVWDGTSLQAAPFLDLSAEITTGGEKGLLGLVFHPDFASNGEFFVNYTRTESGQLQTVISRFTVSSADPDLADPASEEVLLVIDQLQDNHNAGDLAFGLDGYLYIPTGDGGGAGDPGENGQDLGELLGKILRIDVDSSPDPGLEYAIPPDNPFVGQAGARDEIWAYGLRNPFRATFDRETGDYWIGDVGQGDWEEIDLQPAGSNGGENYGWDCREGANDYAGPDNDGLAGCLGQTLTDPVLEYAQESGRCSVTGGYRYRGEDIPQLRGVYVFADFCTGEVFGTVPRCDGAWESQLMLDTPFNITAFGEDASGELYVTERINSDAALSKVHALSLAAGSVGPDLSPSPGSLDFGEIEAGDTVSLVLALDNDNAGPEAASVTDAILSDSALFNLDFAGGPAPCQGGTFCRVPGESCTMAVSLKADLSGIVDETLTFEGNFEPAVVDLQATVLPCSSAQNLTVTNLTVENGQTETRRACDTLTAGPDLTVNTGGDLTLRAGTRIVLGAGVRVESGGTLAVEVF